MTYALYKKNFSRQENAQHANWLQRMAAEARLRAERKSWRQDHPFNFVARPVTKPDGSQDLFEWDCKVRCHGTGNLTPACC